MVWQPVVFCNPFSLLSFFFLFSLVQFKLSLSLSPPLPPSLSLSLSHFSGHSVLHISWLMVALSRIFVHHEAKSIIKWGVQETLDMPLDDSPLLTAEHWGVSC